MKQSVLSIVLLLVAGFRSGSQRRPKASANGIKLRLMPHCFDLNSKRPDQPPFGTECITVANVSGRSANLSARW